MSADNDEALERALHNARRPQAFSERARTAARAADSPRTTKAPSREGKFHIGGYFVPGMKSAVKELAAKELTTVQSLVAEALELLLADRGMGLPVDHQRVRRRRADPSRRR